MSGLRKMKAVLTICAALGWWGTWFPELAVWTDAVCVAQEESNIAVQSEENVVEYEVERYMQAVQDTGTVSGISQAVYESKEDAYEIYSGLLYADRAQIKVKSKLIEQLRKYFFGD